MTTAPLVDRLFLDSSTLYSAVSFSQGLERLWKLAGEESCILMASRYVIEKTRRNLHTTGEVKNLDEKLKNLRVVLETDMGLTCPINLPRQHKAVLMAAIASKAHYLLTVDHQAFGKYLGKTIEGVRISAARDYVIGKMVSRSDAVARRSSSNKGA